MKRVLYEHKDIRPFVYLYEGWTVEWRDTERKRRGVRIEGIASFADAADLACAQANHRHCREEELDACTEELFKVMNRVMKAAIAKRLEENGRQD